MILYRILVSKFVRSEFQGLTTQEIRKRLDDSTKRTAIKGSISRWRLTITDILQAPISALVLFNISDLDGGI